MPSARPVPAALRPPSPPRRPWSRSPSVAVGALCPPLRARPCAVARGRPDERLRVRPRRLAGARRGEREHDRDRRPRRRQPARAGPAWTRGTAPDPVTDVFEPGTTYTIGLWLRAARRRRHGRPAGVRAARPRRAAVATRPSRRSRGSPASGARSPGRTRPARSTPRRSTSSPSPRRPTSWSTTCLVSGVRHTPDLSVTPVRDAVPVPFGIAVEPQDLLGGRGELLAHHAEQITPGNQMKPDAIQPTEGTFTFAGG